MSSSSSIHISQYIFWIRTVSTWKRVQCLELERFECTSFDTRKDNARFLNYSFTIFGEYTSIILKQLKEHVHCSLFILDIF